LRGHRVALHREQFGEGAVETSRQDFVVARQGTSPVGTAV